MQWGIVQAMCILMLLQVGTAVVTRQDKRLAVGRLGALVEQIEALVSKDLQVILVSPIAVSAGEELSLQGLRCIGNPGTLLHAASVGCAAAEGICVMS